MCAVVAACVCVFECASCDQRIYPHQAQGQLYAQHGVIHLPVITPGYLRCESIYKETTGMVCGLCYISHPLAQCPYLYTMWYKLTSSWVVRLWKK